MLLPLLLLTITSITIADDCTLQKDFDSIYRLIPTEKIQDLSRFYSYFDNEFNEAIHLFLERKTQLLLFQIQNLEVWRDFYEYIKCAGLDLIPLLFTIENLIIPEGKGPECVKVEAGGVSKYILRFMEIFPVKKYTFQVQLKVRTSKEFKKFYDKVSSEKAYALYAKLIEAPEVVHLLSLFQKYGVSGDVITYIAKLFFNWKC